MQNDTSKKNHTHTRCYGPIRNYLFWSLILWILLFCIWLLWRHIFGWATWKCSLPIHHHLPLNLTPSALLANQVDYSLANPSTPLCFCSSLSTDSYFSQEESWILIQGRMAVLSGRLWEATSWDHKAERSQFLWAQKGLQWRVQDRTPKKLNEVPGTMPSI